MKASENVSAGGFADQKNQQEKTCRPGCSVSRRFVFGLVDHSVCVIHGRLRQSVDIKRERCFSEMLAGAAKAVTPGLWYRKRKKSACSECKPINLRRNSNKMWEKIIFQMYKLSKMRISYLVLFRFSNVHLV